MSSLGRQEEMWPRETTARSGDIGEALDRHRQGQCLRVLQRSTAVCAEAKNMKSLAARTGSYGAGGQPMPGANATWNTNGQVLVSDVAARDVQAATSPANRIARARTKSWRFAGGGEGRRDAEAAKAKSLNGLTSKKPALSKLAAMWPRETTARSGDIATAY
jgi:hypothetical protein